MSLQLIAEHCSPTLAGIKAGSLFPVGMKSRKNLYRELNALNRMLTKKGLRAVPVRYYEDSALIYLYREAHLEQVLQDPLSLDILEHYGYSEKLPSRLVMHLIARMKQKEFPHEVGLFLGYPPEDVKGFIAHPCDGVKCVGCWKVYGDQERAERTFEMYRRCKDYYCRHLREGRPFEQLIVDTRSVMAGAALVSE